MARLTITGAAHPTNVASAVANALFAATGERPRSLPLTLG